MKFVSLLSGGKDSVFATTECERHGHELVCAAHLAPHNNADELDSFCFQSAAHNVVEGVAACLGVPLVRRTWDGRSIDQSLNYTINRRRDEVEELYELLEKFYEGIRTFVRCRRALSCPRTNAQGWRRVVSDCS